MLLTYEDIPDHVEAGPFVMLLSVLRLCYLASMAMSLCYPRTRGTSNVYLIIILQG